MEYQRKTICNIPHAGAIIPDWARKDILINDEELNQLLEFMIDKSVDKIWDFVPITNKMVASISRIIIDMERFRNDDEEIMSKKGMGVYYTHTQEGIEFRRKNKNTYVKCLEIYDDYHKKLEEMVTNCIEKNDKCILIDCHSFHDEMLYTGYSPEDFPDVCIGINGYISGEAQLIIDIFRSKGYEVKVNQPFDGAIVPNKYRNDDRVVAVMIELNRRIYDNGSFMKVKKICRRIFDELNDEGKCREVYK